MNHFPDGQGRLMVEFDYCCYSVIVCVLEILMNPEVSVGYSCFMCPLICPFLCFKKIFFTPFDSKTIST
jgi:hypothetical protein